VTNTPSERPATGAVDPIEVAKRRKRIPLWAVPIFPALLVWGIIYVNGVSNPPAATNTPDAMGAQVYAHCSSCHGSNGEGTGTAPKFAGGDLLKVFPKWQDQVKWVNIGSSNWTAQTGSKTFGDTKKQIGSGGMPGFGPLGSDKSLSCEDIVMVVRYERQHFAGEAPNDELDKLAEQIASGAPVSDIPNCAAS
jgi:mono/diheme cytochrome c family protein